MITSLGQLWVFSRMRECQCWFDGKLQRWGWPAIYRAQKHLVYENLAGCVPITVKFPAIYNLLLRILPLSTQWIWWLTMHIGGFSARTGHLHEDNMPIVSRIIRLWSVTIFLVNSPRPSGNGTTRAPTGFPKHAVAIRCSIWYAPMFGYRGRWTEIETFGVDWLALISFPGCKLIPSNQQYCPLPLPTSSKTT